MEFTDMIHMLLISFIFSSLLCNATDTPGTIERVTKQQILATVSPGAAETPEPFITSPSGKFAAFLIRTKSSPVAGGFGNDFCFVQVRDTSSGKSLWESECVPVSDANSCTLVFDDRGLEMFDGSKSLWSTEADGDHVNLLEMVDAGDMRIIDKRGELSWKASDMPRVGQKCGLPGSPGMAPESPPFAFPVGGSAPFGQQGALQQQQPANNVNLGDQRQPVAGTPAAADAPIDPDAELQPPPTTSAGLATSDPTAIGGAAGVGPVGPVSGGGSACAVGPVTGGGAAGVATGCPNTGLAFQPQPPNGGLTPASAPGTLGLQPTNAGLLPGASGTTGSGFPANTGTAPASGPGAFEGPSANPQQPEIESTLPATGGASLALGAGGQPLVHNSPYDSGSLKGAASFSLVLGIAVLASMLSA